MFAVMVHISQRVYFTSSYFTVEISATHLLRKVIMAFLFDNEIRYFLATPIHNLYAFSWSCKFCYLPHQID